MLVALFAALLYVTTTLALNNALQYMHADSVHNGASTLTGRIQNFRVQQ